MITIDQVLTDVLRRERWPAVTDTPSDRGGLTKGGVTYTNYNAWRMNHGERPLTREEFVGITEGEARAFFEDEFCRPFGFIGDEGIFVLLADWAINAGVDDPAKALQLELRRRDLYRGAIDGIPGPATRAAWLMVRTDLVACTDIELALVKDRIRFHIERAFDAEVREFIRSHPRTQLRNLRGWLNRTMEFIA